LRSLLQAAFGDRAATEKARTWVGARLPVFIYLDEYPEINGHQNIPAYLQRKANNQQTQPDRYFEKLCKVADLDPAQLAQLQTEDKHEERNQIANRASAVVTGEIRRLWKDRKLKIRFNLDGQYFDTLVSDPNSSFDVEVNLDERSRGFRWFFSFYITFAADTAGGNAENAILLLDEPGLHLHIQSQKDLQQHFENDFDNQIIYTTHSPFMVPVQALERLRSVNIDEDKGTVVTNNPSGDARTLAPVRAALGYRFADSLLFGANNLVVEGATDHWIIDAVSTYLANAGKPSLRKGMSLPPADGAPKVPHLVSLLASQRFIALVLFDDENQARSVARGMVFSKLMREKNIIFTTEAWESDKPAEADIEDLLDPAVYERLVHESYSTELSGETLSLNADIPRIVKRFEAAFDAIGLTFHKTRPAGLFYRTMTVDAATLMTPETVERFVRLFSIINDRLDAAIARGSEPFH
jgi:hypothetical protein